MTDKQLLETILNQTPVYINNNLYTWNENQVMTAGKTEYGSCMAVSSGLVDYTEISKMVMKDFLLNKKKHFPGWKGSPKILIGPYMDPLQRISTFGWYATVPTEYGITSEDHEYLEKVMK